jgi:hypothetical protein
MSNAELFLQHLDRVTGRPETVIRWADTGDQARPRVAVFVFKNWPEEGFITGFTFGLSEGTHPDWKLGRPELMISVESEDESWPLAVGFIASKLRGKCPFCYGNTINFHAKISEESDLDAFLLFAPPFLTKEQKSVAVEGYTVNIIGAWPMYSREFDLYQKLGLEGFWNLPDWDPMNVRRRPITASG